MTMFSWQKEGPPDATESDPLQQQRAVMAFGQLLNQILEATSSGQQGLTEGMVELSLLHPHNPWPLRLLAIGPPATALGLHPSILLADHKSGDVSRQSTYILASSSVRRCDFDDITVIPVTIQEMDMASEAQLDLNSIGVPVETAEIEGMQGFLKDAMWVPAALDDSPGI